MTGRVSSWYITAYGSTVDGTNQSRLGDHVKEIVDEDGGNAISNCEEPS